MNKLNQKFRRVVVKKNERGLLFRNGDFERVLQPGRHRVFSWFDELRVETFAIDQPAFSHQLADYLMAKEPAVVEQEFVRVELTDTQVGLRHENGVLVELLPPASRKLYWKGLTDVKVEVLDLAAEQIELPQDLVSRITQTQLRQRAVAGLHGVLQGQVSEFSQGVLSVDGKFVKLLQPGAFAFWRFNRTVAVETVDLRVQVCEVSGQEILTKDKVALRLNLTATWRYADVMQAFGQHAKPAEALYRELQFALRSIVGTRTLDELLENKSLIDEGVRVQVRERLMESGLMLESVGVKDIILPGEMKTILAQVVEAEKSAQANVIRRREETAATRSLLNTAKVMEDSPIALRLKEMETLERVAERIDKISVYGGLEGVLNNLVKLR
ncbi:slipin family protein [Ideonella azotifigens]|nr:slipin family protein [Ideonella azotifigens]MCD2340549.1 slipin family protein [Ideonella azotifigens]